ncbi:MAG: TRAP transporter substrate-binding protein [bacterium]
MRSPRNGGPSRSPWPMLVAIGALLTLSAGRAAAQEAAGATMKIATVAPEGTPWSEGLEEYRKQIEADTGGAVKARVFLGGALGDENESVQACARGQIQAVGASTAALSSIVPELAVLEMPYLFRTPEEADRILDEVALATLEKAFRDRGLVLGFWSENGYRSFGTNFGFVKTPADLKGHKMRSQESPVHLEMYRAFGASPVPIAVTEVLTSLQTGVIDGYDNTPLFSQAAQWTSGTKFYSLTNHIYQAAAIVFNAAWFDALDAKSKSALLAPRAGLMQRMRKEIRALNPLLVENFGPMGIQVYAPTRDELAQFEKAAATGRAAYLAKASGGEKALYAQIEKGLATLRQAGK